LLGSNNIGTKIVLTRNLVKRKKIKSWSYVLVILGFMNILAFFFANRKYQNIPDNLPISDHSSIKSWEILSWSYSFLRYIAPQGKQ